MIGPDDDALGMKYDKFVLNSSRAMAPLMLSLAMLLILPSTGCARKAFAVEVSHGFSGFVHIFCGTSVGYPTQPVRVNSLGGADAASCPGSDVEVRVSRDGKLVTATAVSWERNIDGTPVALSFEVK